MADLFVTLISTQPVISVQTATGEAQKNHPQAAGKAPGGLYVAKRKKQTLRSKSNGGK